MGSILCEFEIERQTLKINKTIGLSSAREREEVRGRIHVRTYIAGISSQYCDGGKMSKCDGGKNFLPGLKISPGCKIWTKWVVFGTFMLAREKL